MVVAGRQGGAAEAPSRLIVLRADRVRVLGGRGQGLGLDPIRVAEPDEPVHPGDGIVVALPRAGGHERAHGGVGAHVPAPAQHAVHVLLLDPVELALLGPRQQERGGLILGHVGAERVRTALAGHLEPPRRVHHGAGVDGVDGAVVGLRGLQEERALLGVEEGELVVHLELGDVGLDLGEVRVEGRVERHVVADPPPYVEPGLEVGRALRPFVGQLLPLAAADPRQGRCQLEVAARSDPLQALQLRDLAQVAGPVSVLALRPQGEPLVAGVHPDHVDAPAPDAVFGAEPKLGEGNGHLHHVPVGGEPPGGLPDGVPRRVLLATDIVLAQVHLHAQGVDEELVGPAGIVEGVEHEPHEVVLEGVVAIGEMGTDGRRGRIERAERRVEGASVVGEQALGAHRRRQIVSGGDLPGNLHHHRLTPRRLIELCVNRDLPLDAGDADHPPLGAEHHTTPQHGRRQGCHRHQPHCALHDPAPTPWPTGPEAIRLEHEMVPEKERFSLRKGHAITGGAVRGAASGRVPQDRSPEEHIGRPVGPPDVRVIQG